VFGPKGNLKLIDFGLSHEIQGEGVGNYKKMLGTYGYMAPEVHKSSVYDIKGIDLYSLGVILFIMVYGSPPFTLSKDSDQHFYLMQNDKKTYKCFMRSL